MNITYRNPKRKTSNLKFFVSLVLVFCSIDIYAQSWLLGRMAGGAGESWSVATDNAGNAFGAGIAMGGVASTFGSITVPGTPGNQTVWVKYNAAGTPLWADGTHAGNTVIFSMATDPSGNLLLLGGFGSATMQIGTFTLTNASGGSAWQYYLAMVSPSGTVLWAVNDGGIATPSFGSGGVYLGAIGKRGALAADDSGNIYIASHFNSPSITIGSHTLANSGSGTSDIFVAKYSPSGSLVWATSAGGTLNEYATGIAIPHGGNVYISGAFQSASVTFGSSVISTTPGVFTAMIAKYSPAGVPLWGQGAGGSSGAIATGIQCDNTGNLYMVGSFGDNTINFGSYTLSRPSPLPFPNQALFLVKYSTTDVAVWGRLIQSGTDVVPGFSVAVSQCGQVWVSGGFTQGISLDATHFLTPPLTITPDPSFIAGYDFSGTVVGAAQLPSGGDDQNGVACDPAGNVYLAGDMDGPYMIVGPDSLYYTTGATEPFFIAKYGNTAHISDGSPASLSYCDTNSVTLAGPAGAVYYIWNDGTATANYTVTASGTYWVMAAFCGDTVLADTFHVTLHAISAITGTGIICKGDSTVFTDSVAGGTWHSSATTIATVNSLTGTVKGLAAGTCTITYTVPSGCYVTKTLTVNALPCINGVQLQNDIQPLLISPNPATTTLSITMPAGAYTTFTIINHLGQAMITQPLSATQTEVNVTTLPAGIYSVRLRGEGDTRVERFVKE